MGEVRAQVRLTNAMDEALVRRGRLATDQVRVFQGSALVDTGAVRSAIPSAVMEELGLLPRAQLVVEFADGRKDMVDVTEPVLFEVEQRETLEEALVLGDEVIIGQTILEKLDLFVDCGGTRLIPNPAHPDQPITKMK